MQSLLEQYGYSKFDIENKVIECWNTIFDQTNKEHFYFDSEDNTGYMEDTGNDDARTEGMSYGMMMALQMDRKDIFDRLWKWTKKYMYLTEGPFAGYFCWHNYTDGKKKEDSGPAPDGEEYFAMALFLAAKRWGNGEGIFNYTEEARAILRTALHGKTKMWFLAISITVSFIFSKVNRTLLNIAITAPVIIIDLIALIGYILKFKKLNFKIEKNYDL